MLNRNIFLFPGQGSQYVGMGKEFYDNFPIVKHTFEEAEDILKIDLRKLCFEGPESALKLTANTQPAILVTSVALCRVFFKETGIKAHLLAGHSLGEYTALVISDALLFSDAVFLVHVRGQAMQEAVPVGKGAMAALLGAEALFVIDLCKEVRESLSSRGEAEGSILSPANFNGAGQVVVAGTTSAVKRLLEVASQKGIKRSVLLEVSAPFHCDLMKPAAKKMDHVLETIPFSEAQIPYIANVDAHIYVGEKIPFRNLLVEQIPRPVQWEKSMHLLSQENISHAFEIGPGKVLTGLLRRINKDVQPFNIQTVEDLKHVSRRK